MGDMGSDDIPDDIRPGISKEIAALWPPGDLADATEEDLIAAMTKAVAFRANLQLLVGQLAAELYRRPERHSWQTIADMVDMPKATVYRSARPFIKPKPKNGETTT